MNQRAQELHLGDDLGASRSAATGHPAQDVDEGARGGRPLATDVRFCDDLREAVVDGKRIQLRSTPAAGSSLNLSRATPTLGVEMRATRFNHVSVHARNLGHSVRFYVDVFGMERLPTYTFALPVRYVRLGDLQLHVFERNAEAPRYHPGASRCTCATRRAI